MEFTKRLFFNASELGSGPILLLEKLFSLVLGQPLNGLLNENIPNNERSNMKQKCEASLFPLLLTPFQYMKQRKQ